MKNYGRKSTFAGFLPGIAGEKGIPLWCFYVNRGQGVVSFGVDDKEHEIMEFYPAHLAYQNVKRTGFRTFIRKGVQFYEPFADETLSQEMNIGMNTLTITEENPESGLKTEVCYYILPEEGTGALVREVSITNLTEKAAKLEILDGMPAVIPYGVSVENLKNMTQTAKAWMQAEDFQGRAELFRLRASMDDLASVEAVTGANFSFAVSGDGSCVRKIVDPEVIFAYDTSLGSPVAFQNRSLADLLQQKQNRSNLIPCSFAALERELQGGETLHLYELYGQVEKVSQLQDFLQKKMDHTFFERKKKEAEALTEDLTKVMTTRTKDPDFDAYCRYTYMDNVLRGGMPVRLSEHKVFYLYSRKHGDLERDYNDFSMLPEYYSQGNGNFRDVNQNRRCDTFFAPWIGRKNIHTFFSLIQLDGYNPLKLEAMTYTMEEGKQNRLPLPEGVREKGELKELLKGKFTPGRLYRTLEESGISREECDQSFQSIMEAAEEKVNASFGEGYWSDHWDYNLDLIEDYLAVFPEEERNLYFEEGYPFYQSGKEILPRRKRYVKTPAGIRQYHFLKDGKDTAEGFVKQPGEGEKLFTVTLLEKMLLLCTLKFAALDACGMGVEMEGGKPGWYDALNGLPGMLGSSMAETYELLRLTETVRRILEKETGEIGIPIELADLMEELSVESRTYLEDGDDMTFWNRRNDSREHYREKIYHNPSGKRKQVAAHLVYEQLSLFSELITGGIERAKNYGTETVPCYFYYELEEYREDEQGILPLSFQVHPVADFLEGPVRYLKLDMEKERKRELYQKVKKSGLYDQMLGMYKVNASLKQESMELGRACAFTPGWLENESIWLHMEYKYLLELLKSGLYDEFARDLRQVGIPFQPEERYGRSHLENSSFLASSSNPDPDIWGKGFVARLSGSTIEFIHMWRIMMFGKEPFTVKDGKLSLQLTPMLPEYLIGDSRRIEAMFLGSVETVYHLTAGKNIYPGNYQTGRITLTGTDGKEQEYGGELPEETVIALRDGKYSKMEVWMEEIQ